MSNIRLRFVTCHDPISEGIRLRENFWASHVEAVTPEGAGPQKYLGAHCDGGVQARDVGYDAKILQQELFVDLAETAPGQADEFYAFLNRHVGEPYDFVICSALQALALRQCQWFATPLVEPAHKISPRDLLLIISGRIDVKM
jgi:hypothetical protein